MRIIRAVFVATVLCSMLALMPAPFPGAAPQANALANGVTFNVLGGKNGAGWGNSGELTSVVWLRDKIWQYAYSTGDWPTTVATQETCGDSNPNTLDQYAYLVGQLLFSVGDYTADFFGASAMNCKFTGGLNGLAVFARASGGGTWGTPIKGTFNRTLNGATRKYMCLKPQLWVVAYAACNTHLESGTDCINGARDCPASDQLGEWNNIISFIAGGNAVQAGGDFNISIHCNWPFPASNCANGPYFLSNSLVSWFNFNNAGNHWEAGVSPYEVTYPTEGPDVPEKLDHFGRSAFFQWLAAPTRILPPYGGNPHRHSDHYLLRVYIG